MQWLLLAYPLLVHAAILTGWPPLEAAALLILAGNLLAPSLKGRTGWTILALLAAAACSIALAATGDGRLFLFAAPSLITLVLATFFLRSLRAGEEAVITRMATAIRGPLPTPVARYTRSVTKLWAGVFLFIAVTNALLATLAPATVWSWFANVASYLLVGAVFVGEWLFRQWWLRGLESLGWWQYLRRLAQIDIRKMLR